MPNRTIDSFFKPQHRQGGAEQRAVPLEEREEDNTPREILLKPTGEPLRPIQAAIGLLNDPQFRINQYLDYEGMDAIKAKEHSGKTIIHLIIQHASRMKYSEEAKNKLEECFRILQQKIEEADDKLIFQPNYPAMNSYTFSGKIDFHMISPHRILEKYRFAAQEIKNICETNLQQIQHIYETREFDDESGDSEDDIEDPHEERYAPLYKKHLIKWGEYITRTINTSPAKKVEVVKGRVMNQYDSKYGFAPKSMAINDENGKIDESKSEQMFAMLNSFTLHEQQRAIIGDIAIPLFHGVPLMPTQYTNSQRREIFDILSSINEKLMDQFAGQQVEFTAQEQAFLTPHSRTAMASANLQSLHEITTATPEKLEELTECEDRLFEYFRNHGFNKAFKDAMKIFIFKFGENKTKEFWEKMKKACNDIDFPEEIIKYRFPIIATSKTPDHAFKFAIGSGIEKKRGEGQLNPWYNWEDENTQAKEGFPYHRFAGIIYVTLHDLQELQEGFNNGTIIDVNRGLSLELIGSNISASRFKYQQEVDFLGKMGGKVIALIPILYPYIRNGNELVVNYHEAIYGLQAEGISRNSRDNPQHLREILRKNAVEEKYNPAMGNDETFGKMMAHSFVDLAHAAVLAATKAQGKFPCTLSENNELQPYNLFFDNSAAHSSQLSYTHRELKNARQATAESQTRNWQKLAQQDLDIFLHAPRRAHYGDDWPTRVVIENSSDPEIIAKGIEEFNVNPENVRNALSREEEEKFNNILKASKRHGVKKRKADKLEEDTHVKEEEGNFNDTNARLSGEQPFSQDAELFYENIF